MGRGLKKKRSGIMGGGLAVRAPSRPHALAGGLVEWRDDGGILHREDGPARIYPNGSREWWTAESPGRADGLFIDRSDGYREWRKDGLRHRLGAPARIFPDGGEEWWTEGELHREDGPAKMSEDGLPLWYRNGKFHREGGPARIYLDEFGKLLLGEHYIEGERQKIVASA